MKGGLFPPFFYLQTIFLIKSTETFQEVFNGNPLY